MKAGHLIAGYRGGDVVVRDELVSRRLAFRIQSRNDYDWLDRRLIFANDAERTQFLFP